MTYEQFIEQVKWEVEDIARESFDDVRTVVRTVTKNNNVRRKTISIFKEGQLATESDGRTEWLYALLRHYL